jgi:lysozyme family protein
MICRVPFVTMPLPDLDRREKTQGFSNNQQTNFFNILVKAIGKPDTKTSATLSEISLPSKTISLTNPLPAELTTRPLSRRDMIRFVMTQEGSKFIAKDGGNESSKYGILQTTAERYGYQGTVKNMSREDAENIYEKIWQESGARNLKPDLALVHFDTFVNSPSAANKILKACDGNVDDYLTKRSQRYNRLSSIRPERYGKYLKGWMNRIENLRSMVAENTYLSPTKAST